MAHVLVAHIVAHSVSPLPRLKHAGLDRRVGTTARRVMVHGTSLLRGAVILKHGARFVAPLEATCYFLCVLSCLAHGLEEGAMLNTNSIR